MKKTIRYYELHAEVCKTFGHPKRLLIINLLRKGELTVSEISRRAQINKSNLSQHLHILREKGLVKTRRKGTRIYYRLAHPNIIKAYDLISAVLLEEVTESQTILKEL